MLCLAPPAWAQKQADYVIAISVDGLGSKWLQPRVDGGEAPHFKRFIAAGAWTYNARADYDYTVTLPNHATMLTSRGVLGTTGAAGGDGHDWTENTDPKPGETLHSNKKSYVASVLDVAHDNGLRTGLFVTKAKFSLFETSYDAEHGAEDKTGPDNGRNKYDLYECSSGSVKLTDRFIETMKDKPFNFAFLHFTEGDTAGHALLGGGWGSPKYIEAVKTLDGCLGRILDLVEKDPKLKGRTLVILTADHGGHGRVHDVKDDPFNYTIPFGVVGAGVTPGTDLYALNPGTRKDPGAARPDYKAAGQPIRNGDVGNLALKLLGLGPIPGSRINVKQDLSVTAPAAVPAAALGGNRRAVQWVREPTAQRLS
jgi:predicted AlkP superfamily pyrophosphatase or phosphodiesterase